MGFKFGGSTGGGGVDFGPPSANIDIGDAQQAGTSERAARADHQHAFPHPSAAPPPVSDNGAVGSASTPARSDHTHAHTAADHLAGGHADLTSAMASAAATAVSAHTAAVNPHPQYLTSPDVTGVFDPIGSATSSITSHINAGDPHPQYTTDQEVIHLIQTGQTAAPLARHLFHGA